MQSIEVKPPLQDGSVVPTKVLSKCVFQCSKASQPWQQGEVGPVGLLGLSAD